MPVVLRDVHYVIEAHFEMTDKAAPTPTEIQQFRDIVKRRLRHQTVLQHAYFGTREFPVSLSFGGQLPPCPEELLDEHDLGWMLLLDMDYSVPPISPMFFRAKLVDGVAWSPVTVEVVK